MVRATIDGTSVQASFTFEALFMHNCKDGVLLETQDYSTNVFSARFKSWDGAAISTHTFPVPRFDVSLDLDRSCLEEVDPIRFQHHSNQGYTNSTSADYDTNMFLFESNVDTAPYNPVLTAIA